MKSGYFLLLLVALLGCNHPGLNDQQKEQLRQGKAERSIRRITEAEILETAKQQGESLIILLPSPNDTTVGAHKAIWLPDSIKATNTKLAEIQEAYAYSAEHAKTLPSHIESYNNDSLLFAKPMAYNELPGVWFIFLNKKEIVRTISQ